MTQALSDNTSNISRRVLIRGHDLEFFLYGTGRPLLFLHCILGVGSFAPIFDILSPGFSVHVPIYPGYGEANDDASIRTVEDLVYYVLDFCDAMNWHKVDIVGVSLGSWLAAEIAARNPERVNKLLLASPMGLSLTKSPMPEIFGLSNKKLASLLFYNTQSSINKQLFGLAATISSAGFGKSEGFNLYRSLAAAARYCWTPYCHDPRLRSIMHRIKAPVLTVWGKEDMLLSAEYATAYASLIPHSQTASIEGAGHLLHLDRPEEFALHVKRFFTN